MSQELDNLRNEVEEAKTVHASAAALLSGLKGRLDTAIEQLAQQGVTNEALNELSSDLDASTNELAAAVAANTVAENEEPEENEDPAPGEEEEDEL